ncbi:MAG: hypothetical protein ACLR4Z_04580 [Butyricicoccaceae bacterium]
MKLHLVKRCGNAGGVRGSRDGLLTFSVASLNGLRYVRPTAENWTLLAYVEPAARVEQQVRNARTASISPQRLPASTHRSAGSGRSPPCTRSSSATATEKSITAAK